MDKWQNYVNSKSTEEMNNNWKTFKSKYLSIKDAIEYVENQWVPLINHFATFKIDKFCYLNCLSTQRVEGTHAHLKKFIKTKRNNLLQGYQKIKAYLNCQIKNYNQKEQYQQHYKPLCFKNQIFQDIV